MATAAALKQKRKANPSSKKPKLKAVPDVKVEEKLCPYSDTRKAWEIVLKLEDEGTLRRGIFQWGLASVVDMEDAIQFARISAHKSIMCWEKDG